jgi:hypothetical protein
LLLRVKSRWLRAAHAQKMHRFLVNIKSADIFKGILQAWKSTQNAENFAEMRTKFTWAAQVNHTGINHAAPPARVYLALMRRRRAEA